MKGVASSVMMWVKALGVLLGGVIGEAGGVKIVCSKCRLG